MSSQEQNVDKGSTAVQSGRDTHIIIGVSASEVRQIALDIFKSNYLDLRNMAVNTAAMRAEEITDAFLKKLQIENPAGLLKAQDPGFQYDLFTAQKEHAKNGDYDLGSLLVDLLVDRSKVEQRDILQIVLSESLSTAPKLTNEQLAVLAIIFLFRYTKNPGVLHHVLLGEYFDKYARPFAEKLSKTNSCYQHLQFAGCGSIELRGVSLENALCQNYQGLFLKGFDINEINSRGITVGMDKRFFIQCQNNPEKIQVNAQSRKSLETTLDEAAISPDDKSKIIALFDREKMSEGEIRNKCISLRPYMATIFDVWSSSPMCKFSLTSVGMALGHANVKRLTGEFANLRIWIN